MNVLVAVDSRHGATTEIGRAIADRLTERGLETTTLAAEEVTGVGGYDGVVLGSAVYTGHWLSPAKKLAAREHELLLRRPVWLFSSGPIGDPPFPNDEPAEVDGLLAVTGARAHRTFAGRLDPGELGFLERTMVDAAHAPEGDFRDWDEIRSYADEIADSLLAAAQSGG